MQTYDIIMIAILGVSILFGFLKGFAWQIASVAAFGVSYFVAANFNGTVAEYFGINPFVSMFLLFIGTALVIWITYGVIHKKIEQFQLKSFDRQIGAIVGLGTGIILCLAVTFVAVMTGEDMGRKVVQSRSGKYITQVIRKLDGVLPVEIKDRVDPYLERLDKELEDARNGVGKEPDPAGTIESSDDSGPPLSAEEKWLREMEKRIREFDR